MQQKLVYFRIQNNNMSLKGTLIMGLVLFCLRLVLCISCLVIHTFVTSDYNWTIPLWIWAIIFGIGVLSDIVLIYGATKKDVTGCLLSELLILSSTNLRSREYRFTHMNCSTVDIPFLSETLSGGRI